MYPVKSIYPEFKCLTIFRKVMKRIETAKGVSRHLMRQLKSGSTDGKDSNYAGCKSYNPKTYKRKYSHKYAWLVTKETSLFQKHLDSLMTEHNIEIDKKKKEMFGDEDYNMDAWDELYSIMAVKYPMFHRYSPSADGMFQDFDRNYPIKWLWGEQGKYEMMGKKFEFYQAMLARDKRVRTISSLNDDVIGVIYSYL